MNTLLMSCTLINQRVFGIRLFEHPTDIERLAPFFYICPDSPIAEEVIKKISAHDDISKPIHEEVIKETLIASASVDDKVVAQAKQKPTQEEVIKESSVSVGDKAQAQAQAQAQAKPNPKPNPKTSIKARRLPADTLFWNIYIAIYGWGEYTMIGTKYANVEWTEKNNIRMAFMTTPKTLQSTNHKVTLGNIQEMMSEYMTGGKTTLLGLIGYSVYYKMPIYLLDNTKKTYLRFLPTTAEKPPCVLFKNGGIYELYEGGERDDVETLCGNYVCLESYHRPLRAISTYKRGELDTLANFAGITVVDKTKDQLYRDLSEWYVWKI